MKGIGDGEKGERRRVSFAFSSPSLSPFAKHAKVRETLIYFELLFFYMKRLTCIPAHFH